MTTNVLKRKRFTRAFSWSFLVLVWLSPESKTPSFRTRNSQFQSQKLRASEPRNSEGGTPVSSPETPSFKPIIQFQFPTKVPEPHETQLQALKLEVPGSGTGTFRAQWGISRARNSQFQSTELTSTPEPKPHSLKS